MLDTGKTKNNCITLEEARERGWITLDEVMCMASSSPVDLDEAIGLVRDSGVQLVEGGRDPWEELTALPGPNPGGEHRPAARRRKVRLAPRLPVLDVCLLVDPPGDQPRGRGPGADDPATGAHHRTAYPALQHGPRAPSGARPRADSRGNRGSPRDRAGGGARSVSRRQGPDLPRDAHWR